MKLSEIYALANVVAPKALSDEFCAKYGAYDNSGVLVDAGEEITGVLFSLDCSDGAVARAKKEGCNLILTHHPLIYGKLGEVLVDAPVGGKVVACLKAGISVLSMHLNLDAADGGIDETLMQGIAKCAGGLLENVTLMQPLSQGGYGRAYDVAGAEFSAFTENVKKEFSTNRLVCYGKGQVKRIASFCGGGGDERAIDFALMQGADTVISADFRHHVIARAVESGLKVILMTHYASEQYGFEKYYQKIRRQLEIPCVYHTDEELF